MAVFRDELKNLLPDNDDADRLARSVHHFPEFFEANNLPLHRLTRDAVVWGHCHHKATGGMRPELKLLRERMGMNIREAKGGCCGLAGSWGFGNGKYELSIQCAEVGMLPAVRNATRDAIIVADGFSCKTQLEQSGLDRRALHTAEVIKLARDRPGVRGPRPERDLPGPPSAPHGTRAVRAAVLLAAGALAATLASRLLRRSWGACHATNRCGAAWLNRLQRRNRQ